MADPISVHAKYALIGETLEIIENAEIVIGNDLKILEITESRKKIDETTVLMPAFFNAHAHAGDHGLRGVKSDSLEHLVGPDGLKVKYLNSLTDQKLRLNLENFNYESSILGIGGYNDFREGGFQGILPYIETPRLNKKVRKSGFRKRITGFENLQNRTFDLEDRNEILPFIQILGRPNRVEELDLVLDYGGLGVRDLYAYDLEDLFYMSRTVEKKDAHFQIHAGEDPELTRRSMVEHGMGDIQFCVENFKPNAIVHGNYGTIEDYSAIKENGTGLILCPRSNIFTKTKLHPYQLIGEAGLSPFQIGLGSDNAMFHSPSLWKEMKALYDNSHFSAKEILQMATIGGAKVSGFEGWEVKEGNYFNGNKWFFPRTFELPELYIRLIFQGRNAAIMHFTR